MEDDISLKISSAYQAFELAREQARKDSELEKKAKKSSLKLAALLNEQTGLLREANERAASMEEKAEESGREARVAKRHAVLANIIALVALALTALQYLSHK